MCSSASWRQSRTVGITRVRSVGFEPWVLSRSDPVRFPRLRWWCLRGGSFKNGSVDALDRGWVRKHIFQHYEKQRNVVVFGDDGISSDHIATLHTLSRCPNIVVASSSYSWWGAFLSNHSNVVAPRMLHDPKHLGFKPDDYYPPEWTLIGRP
jgi:Glycosyl transferase family 11